MIEHLKKFSMSRFFLLLVPLLAVPFLAFGQKDCCTAEPLFGNMPLTIPSNSGHGTLEDLSACSCLATDEHDSYWFAFQCITGGTFEMMITPLNLGADYDFALFANNCPCNNTTVVSCDYTGPINPPGPFVPTGISSDPMGTFGVPGTTEFQPTVTLTAGTVYYLIADNITTNGVGFEIEFAGTAVIGPPPVAPPPPPPAPLLGSTNACPGAELPYSVPSNPLYTNYEWTVNPPVPIINGNGSNSVNVTWTTPGSYDLCVVGQSGCAESSPVCITVDVTPIVTQPMSDIICLGETYTAPDGQTFTDPGVYDLQFTSYQGCDSIVQLILQPAPPSVTILVEEICDGDCVFFGGEQRCQSGIYEQVLENWQGCDSTVTLNLIVVPNEAVVTGADTITCTRTSVVLDGSESLGGSNLTYEWTNASGTVLGTADTLLVTTPGSYTLTITHQVGGNTCSDSETVVVVDGTQPPQGVSATGGTIDCNNNSVTLQGNSSSPGVTYAWSGPGGFASNEQNPTVSAVGTYVLTVTGANGCTATATAQVNGDSSLPQVSATGGTLTCSTDSVMLQGNSTTAGVTFEWSGPGGFTSPLQNPNVGQAGTYTLVVSAPNGCSAQTSVEVDEDFDEPDAFAEGDTLDCQHPSVTLSGGSATPGVSFSWMGPGGFASNDQNPAVAQPGSYVLTVTAPNGCTATATALVEQDADLPDVVAEGGTLTCSIASVELQGSSTTPGVSWYWVGPGGFSSTEQNPLVDQAGTYILTVTAPNGCSASVNAEVFADIDVPDVFAEGDTLTCTVGSVTLIGQSNTPGVSFHWTGPGGFTSSEANPTVGQAGNYTLTVTAPNGCTASTTATVFQDEDLPTAFATGGTLDCNTTSVTLDGSTTTPGASFTWTGPAGFTSTDPMPVVNVPGTYVFTVTSTNGCTASATAPVVLDDQVPEASAQGGTLSCEVTSVELSAFSATPGVSFHWTGPGGFSNSQPNPAVNVPGTYVLTVTAPNGCTATATTVVDEDITPPDVSAEGGTLTCATTSVALTGSSATPNVGFQWSGPGGFQSNQADTSTTQPGMYTLTVTAANGCTAEVLVEVDEDTAPPNVNATGGIISCVNPVVALSGSSTTPGVSWSWTGAGGFSSTEQNPQVDAPGTYVLTVTAANGCTATDNAVVIEDKTPPGAAASGGTLTCLMPSIALSASSTTPGVDYLWTGPGSYSSTAQNPQVTEPGTYVLTVTAPNGCTATATALVDQDADLPDATATGGTLTCLNPSLALMGGSTTPGVSWWWTGPAGFTSTEQNPLVDVPGIYTLTVTAPNGCTKTATTVVNENKLEPDVIASGGKITCANEEVTLMALSGTTGVSWAWTGPGGFSASEQNPVVDVPGMYTLTVTAPNGCTATATVEVKQDTQPPTVSASGGELTCQQPAVTLLGNSTTFGVNWAWTGPGGFTSSEQNPVVTTPGTYMLTVTAPNGCTATASVEVTQDAALPQVSATGGTLTCAVQQVQLVGASSQADVSWAWSGPGGFTSNEQNPVVTLPGTYVLTVSTTTGCSATASAEVAADTVKPKVTIAPAAQLDCQHPQITLDGSGSASGPTFAIQWATADGSIVSGEQTLTPVVDAAGTYTLTVTNLDNGCSASMSVVVEPSAEAPSGAEIVSEAPTCAGQADGFIIVEGVVGGTPPFQYSLDGGPFQDQPSFFSLSGGNYQIAIRDAAGCEWRTEVVLVEPAPLWVELIAQGLGSEPLPLGQGVQLVANTGTPADQLVSVSWMPDSIAAGCKDCLSLSVTPEQTTTYSVTLTDANGCTASDFVLVPVDSRRKVYVPNVFSPDNDGINDRLTVFAGAGVVRIRTFMIFNRWGESVYELHDFPPNDLNAGWDGRYRGKPMDPAVFVWFAEVEFIDGNVELFAGDVLLTR